LTFYRATVTGVDVVRILRDPWNVDADSSSRDTAEPASLLDLAPTLGQLGLDELLEAPWVHVEPRKKETTRVYRVPRRFGVGALLVVTAFFCGLLGVLRLFGSPPPITVYIGLQVAAAGVMQMVIRKSPRAASALAGAVLLPVTVVFFAVLYEGAWEVIAATPCLAVAGFPLGYLAGGLIAGVFMFMEMADDWIARRTNRAAETDSPHPLAEPTDAEPDQDDRQATPPDHDDLEE
jgi:hypothetical protein